MRQLRYLRY
jgi:hypothetical protein